MQGAVTCRAALPRTPSMAATPSIEKDVVLCVCTLLLKELDTRVLTHALRLGGEEPGRVKEPY